MIRLLIILILMGSVAYAQNTGTLKVKRPVNKKSESKLPLPAPDLRFPVVLMTDGWPANTLSVGKINSIYAFMRFETDSIYSLLTKCFVKIVPDGMLARFIYDDAIIRCIPLKEGVIQVMLYSGSDTSIQVAGAVFTIVEPGPPRATFLNRANGKISSILIKNATQYRLRVAYPDRSQLGDPIIRGFVTSFKMLIKRDKHADMNFIFKNNYPESDMREALNNLLAGDLLIFQNIQTTTSTMDFETGEIVEGGEITDTLAPFELLVY